MLRLRCGCVRNWHSDTNSRLRCWSEDSGESELNHMRLVTINTPMNPTLIRPVRYEFCFPEKDTLVLVEVMGNDVTVRATRDTFTGQRKASFVRELAAEGFIPDSYLWFSPTGPDSYFGVRWLIDYSWLIVPASVMATARRFMLRLFAGSSMLWLVLIAVFVV